MNNDMTPTTVQTRGSALAPATGGEPRGIVFWRAFNAPTGGKHHPDWDWPSVVAWLSSPPLTGGTKDSLPLWSPATFRADHRSNANVERVNFLVWDLDSITAPRLRELTARLDELQLRYVVHTTPSNGIKPELCLRLALALSRPVAGTAWLPFWRAARAFLQLPEQTDKSCKDACRQFYVPGVIPGTDYGVSVRDDADRAPLNVDHVLSTAPAFTLPAAFEPGRDPTPRDAVENLANRLKKNKGTDPKPIRLGTLMRSGLEGHSIATEGDAHDVLRDLSWELAKAFPTGKAGELAGYFHGALDLMRAWAKEDPHKHFVDLIESAQRKIQAEQARKQAERAADTRPTIRLGAERSGQLEAQADASIEALAPLEIFQRSGSLCHVTQDAVPDRIVRPNGTPTIRDLPIERLRELLDRVARFEAVQENGSVKAVHPPYDVVNAIAKRGQWSHIRPLRGTVSFPILRPDGSLLMTPGYDAATATLSSCALPSTVPDLPTRDDAMRATRTLLELVSDFPFADDAARSVWLASLLTPLARTAIDGPVPLTILDANARGAGKTRLAGLVGRIVLGQDMPVRTAPETQEEWRKALFAMVLAGDPLVLIDNVTRMVQSSALDAILTGTTYGDRVLGISQERTLPVRTTFMLSSNNARLSTDLVRRSLQCRLESQTERPEHRTGFRHPRILEHATEHRAQYLSAALTILRAYIVAGRPRVPCRPIGSFESWSSWVAAPLVWLDLPDPASTQDALREFADVERDDVGALLRAWLDLFPDQRPITARELVAAAELTLSPMLAGAAEAERQADRVKRQALRDALLGLFESNNADRLPAVSKLGYRLRALRGTIVGGLTLQQTGEARNAVALWRVTRCAC